MELETRLLTLPRDKQLRVVQRIFQKMALGFGRSALDMWADMEMQAVYEDWADALQGCSMGAIQYGIEAAKDGIDPKPPTRGQFKALCKKYQPVQNVYRIAHRLTPEELEANKKRIEEVIAGLAKHCRN